MIKAVLFDVDGTLVFSNDSHAHAWQEAFAEYGYDTAFDDIRKLIGMGSDKLISSLVPKLSHSEGDGKLVKDKRRQIFLQKYVKTLNPTPGSRRLVEFVQKQGLRTIVASSASQDELGELLKAAQVDDLLKQATTSDDAENSKPDPDIVIVAVKKLGLKVDEVVMVGDTPYDIEAAKLAGIRCIAVRCGEWSDDDLRRALAIYQDPEELLSSHLLNSL